MTETKKYTRLKFGELLEPGDVWGHPDRGFSEKAVPDLPDGGQRYEPGMENDSDRSRWYRPESAEERFVRHQTELTDAMNGIEGPKRTEDE